MTTRLKKAALSHYLRTRCDRMLACQITEQDPSATTLLPLPARPGLAGFQERGKEFETEFLADLRSLFPDRYVNVEVLEQPGLPPDLAFKRVLERLAPEDSLPRFYNEPTLAEERYRDVLLKSLGLDESRYPSLTNLRPDLVIVLRRADAPAHLTEFEILPNCTIRRVQPGDVRIPLRVVDLKFAEQLNTAYAGEVCFYSMVLAAWLGHPDIRLAEKFYVTAVPGVLVRHTDRSTTMPAATTSITERMEWFESQIDSADADLYLPPVERFLRKDVPRVLAGLNDWRSLEWQVAPTCAFCDYLGYPGWSKHGIGAVQKSATTLRKGQPTPKLEDYCFEDARRNHRVNQLPNLTRGMLRTLDGGNVTLLTDLRTKTGAEKVFDAHNGLKVEALRLPRKAAAVVDNQSSPHPAAISGQLARYPELVVCIVCFFDAATGLLTSLGMSVDYRSPSELTRGIDKDGKLGWIPDRPVLDRKQQMMWVVEEATSAKEGEHLLDCLRFLSRFIEYVLSSNAAPDGILDKQEWERYCKKNARVQVLFWDKAQDNAFREAIGRHLHLITHAKDISHALVWLFPPDEIVRSDKIATTPAVAYLHHVVTRLAALPTTVNDDILSVASHLAGFDDRTSSYMWDRIAGVIPKERSLEITQKMPPKRPPMAISQCVEQYRTTLRTLLHALRAIFFKIQRDYKQQLQGDAPLLANLQPTKYNHVAADSMLWLTHQKVSEGADNLDRTIAYTLDPHELEASYKALRVNGRLSDHEQRDALSRWRSSGIAHIPPILSSNYLLYHVRRSSQFVKFRNDSGFMVLLPEKPVGAGNMKVQGLCWALDKPVPQYALNPLWPDETRYLSLLKLLQAKLVYFDREKLIALVKFDDYIGAFNKIKVLHDEGILDLDGPMMLMEGRAVPYADIYEEAAKEIGNPSIAKPAVETQSALLKLARGPGSDAITAAARILWDADALVMATSTTDVSNLDKLLDETLLKLPWPQDEKVDINDDQRDAIRKVLSQRLMPVWGGPGTGKTQTLSAAIILEILLRIKSKQPRQRIYVTGPTYRSVIEVATRLRRFLDYLPNKIKGHLQQHMKVAFVSSSGYPAVWNDLLDAHQYSRLSTEKYIGNEFSLNGMPGDGSLNTLRNRLLTSSVGIDLVFSVAKQSHKIGLGGSWKKGCTGMLVALFDRIYIDESSQISVVESLPTLALLSEEGRLGLFGDPMQMPPIQSIDAPQGAEFMVGSIHTYLKERFAAVNSQEHFLRVNYRSCEPIVRFARMIGYKSEFTSYKPNLSLPYIPRNEQPNNWPSVVHWSKVYDRILDRDRPCVAVTYDDGLSGQANDFEAALVAGTVLSFRLSEQDRKGTDFSEEVFWAKSVGVVTPHRAQRASVVEILRRALAIETVAANLIDDAIDTVERFQGGERDLILVSFGVGDPDLISSEEEFLFQRQRINVAISRAKSKAVLFISRDLLLHLPEDPEVIQTSRAIKSFAFQLATERDPLFPITFGGNSIDVEVCFAGYAKQT